MAKHTRTRVFPPQPERVFSASNMESFKASVRMTDTGDWRTSCWLWLGKTKNGYGEFSPEMGVSDKTGKKLKKRWYRAHRYSWQMGDERTLRPLSSHLDIDHMCHNNDETCAGGVTCLHRRCVRPDHLMPSSPEENYQRMLEQRKAHRVWKRSGSAESTFIEPAPVELTEPAPWIDFGDPLAVPYWVTPVGPVKDLLWGLDKSWLS